MRNTKITYLCPIQTKFVLFDQAAHHLDTCLYIVPTWGAIELSQAKEIPLKFHQILRMATKDGKFLP